MTMLSLTSKQADELKRITEDFLQKLPHRDIFKLLQKTRKNQQQFYHENAISKEQLNLSDVDLMVLEQYNLLKTIDQKTRKVIPTLKAMFMCRYDFLHNPTPSVLTLLEDLNKMFFEDILQMSKEELEGREKAIVLTLLGLGALCEGYELKFDENLRRNEETFKKVVGLVVEFLKCVQYHDETLDKLWTREVKGENKVSGELRRLNTLEPRTEGICVRTHQGTYLKLVQNGKLDGEALRFLLSKIFNKQPLSFEQKTNLKNLLSNISLHNSLFFRYPPPFSMSKVLGEIKGVIDRF
jgi:hypothetical protein